MCPGCPRPSDGDSHRGDAQHPTTLPQRKKKQREGWSVVELMEVEVRGAGPEGKVEEEPENQEGSEVPDSRVREQSKTVREEKEKKQKQKQKQKPNQRQTRNGPNGRNEE